MPPPGYPPPGYAPGYYMPPPPYVPPAVYHIPAADGRPPQMVPPASGSLLQAWLSIAVHPSRQNIAAWAQIATAGWVRASIIVAVVLQLAYATVLALVIHSIVESALSQATGLDAATQSSLQSMANLIFGVVLIAPVTYLLKVFAIPFGQALFMSSGLGTTGQRFQRALKPWALAQVGMTSATFLFGLLIVVLLEVQLVPSLQSLIASNGASGPSTAFVNSVFTLYGLIFLVYIPFTVYQYMMQIQSGAVGAAMNRWAIFGINLLTALVVGLVLNIVLQPIFFATFLRSVATLTPIVTPGP